MNATLVYTPQALIIQPADSRIDAAVAVDFKDYLLSVIARGQCNMVIDLSRVESIDSSGIAALLVGLKMLGPRGDLALCNMRPDVARAFSITRMDRVLC